jgi:hypothetical protein
MLLDEARALIQRLIKSGETHKDYDRTVELARDYRIFITSKDIEKKLIQFVQREDAALFAQRLRLTKSTTPAVASSIRGPFNKVVRNDRVRKTVKLDNETRQKVVEKMQGLFYGAARKKNRGLEYWLKTRFLEMQFTDPNSWTVVEWDAPATPSEVIKPRPFEVSAEMAVNFFIANDETKWLLVRQAIKYKTVTPGAVVTTGAIQATTEETEIKKDGYRWTLYDEDVTVVMEQVDKDYLKAQGFALSRNQEFITIKNVDYLASSFEPNVGYVPAFRIGYKRDEETSGRTFVNPWHDALCFFEKSLKTVSELDLTMALHTFPQKLQYVQQCPGQMAAPGIPRRGCNKGIIQGTTSTPCPICEGKGYKLHTTAQDAILLPMPTDPKNEDIVDLEKLLVYKAPPIELIKFQNDYCQQLERQAHQAVFNSQVFVKKSGGGITEQQSTDTATGAEYNMQSVYDALEPFTEKFSEMWKEFVTVFAVIAGEELDKIDVSHDFPADYKLKTSDILLSERKTANESGAPAFLIETIDDDLATIIYGGDDLGLQKYRVKRRFSPFTGKNENEVALLLASEFVPDEPKVLYSNFELIFKELEADAPEFWTMTDLKKQRQMVEEKVAEWVQKLKDAAPAPTFQMFKPTTDGGTGQPADQNPGETGQQQQQPAAA